MAFNITIKFMNMKNISWFSIMSVRTTYICLHQKNNLQKNFCFQSWLWNATLVKLIYYFNFICWENNKRKIKKFNLFNVRKLSDNKNQKLQCNICPFFCFLFSFLFFSFVCSLLTTRKVVVTLSFLVNLIEVILSEVILHCCSRAHF